MDEDTIFKVTFVHDGYWKEVKSSNGLKYVEGRQFTEKLDADKIAMIDLWEDIGPWSRSTNPARVTFTYMLPNVLLRQYVEIGSDAKLLEIFFQNRRTKKFTLYVVHPKDVAPAPSISHATTSYIDFEGVDMQDFQQEIQCAVDELHVVDELFGGQEERLLVESEDDEPETEKEYEDVDAEKEDEEEGDSHPMEGVLVQGVFEPTEGVPEEEDKEPEDEEPLLDYGSLSEHELEAEQFEGQFIEVDSESPNMIVDSRFSSVQHFRYALKQHCVINEFAVKYIKNERNRVTAKCRVADCSWRIHASELQDHVTFEVRTLNDIHSCTSVNKVGNEMVTSGWLAQKIVPIIHRTPELGASKLKNEIQTKYNLTLPYSRVLKARGKAVELVHGIPADSFKLIPELREELLKANPGSIVEYQLDDHCQSRMFNLIVRQSKLIMDHFLGIQARSIPP
ncbi:hypothetical protein QJS10_CPB14g00665 [Acorus calamus]|uniref:Transposase MuDR plant domain-containing protein n=1 Tax=Acorus calamus TaxID=4465 RepID=A0AAV9DE03_ACOCL|nr:hypothetical protein QJS10_CPB14g00665 [Acorus calamus]